MEKITAMQVRQQLGELLSRLKLRGEEFIIEQYGRPTAVLLPYAKVAQVRAAAWEDALDVLQRAAQTQPNQDLTESSLNDLVNDAVHATRA